MKKNINSYISVAETLDQRWEKAGIGNAFIFANVMRTNPELLLELLQYTLPEMEIVSFAGDPSEEVSIKTALDAHGIRLDIIVRDAQGRMFDVEMQMEDEGNIPRRIRYYAGTLDQTSLKPGQDYNALHGAVVLFIIPFDPFGKKLYKYTFRNFCAEEKELELGDGSQKVVLNASGRIGEIPDALKGFLELVRGHAQPVSGTYAGRVQEKVNTAKRSSKVRREFMTWEMTLLVERNKGKAEGELLKLIKLVKGKLSRGQSAEKISEDLLEQPDLIDKICGLLSADPDAVPEDILGRLLLIVK